MDYKFNEMGSNCQGFISNYTNQRSILSLNILYNYLMNDKHLSLSVKV